MTDDQFKNLKLSIEALTDELEFHQSLYTREVGQRYIPPLKLDRKDLINDCIHWNESGKYYNPLELKR